MSVSSRASELFSGENWQVIYEAYTQINFNASDPPSINQALQTYIQTNYPEYFNDWIVQSEFVALIDMLSWISGILAFKTDIAVRENFMSVAQSKDSILRLARFLSYNPSRNSPAQGVLKLVNISTTDTVYDSLGVNLSNMTITWNNPDDANWYERFTTILNDAFVTTNPFGVPLQSGTTDGIQIQTYRFNSVAADNTYAFTASVGGTQMDFEFCNGEYSNNNLVERTPNPTNAYQIYYMNDGNGNGSTNTGFFVMFKQGTTNTTLFNIPSPVQNTLLNINTTNVNNNDVWVQTVNDSGDVLVTWSPVPIMLSENITYNSLPTDERNIYSVITRDNDQISVRFSDGNFANAPVGNILVTYRTSNGLRYTINPNDISNVTLSLNYINALGSSETLTLTFSLQNSLSNSIPSETTASIQQNAPLVYATQNRMVSGQDYNTFPLQTNLAVKLKSLNRVYSGQSRYFDLNDPTGFYQDLTIFGHDGILFYEIVNNYAEVYLNINLNSNLVSDYIQPILSSQNMDNVVHNALMQGILNGTIITPSNLSWTQSSATLYSTTGWFNQTTPLITTNSLIQFTYNNISQWVGVSSVNGSINYQPPNNTAGPVILNEVVPTGSIVNTIMPAYNAGLPESIINTINFNFATNISFSLAYDYINGWVVNAPVLAANLVGTINPNSTQITVMEVDYLNSLWRINALGTRYVFESITTVEWFDDASRAIDEETDQSVVDDTITVLSINTDLQNPNGNSLQKDYVFDIAGIWTYRNGQPEPRRTVVEMSTTNGVLDEPDSYLNIISNNVENTLLFWKMNNQDLLEPSYSIIVFTTLALLQSAIGQYAPTNGTVAFVLSGNNPSTNNSFWVYGVTGWVQDLYNAYEYEYGRGPNVAALWISNSSQLSEINNQSNFINGPIGSSIKFQWQHYASYNDRIDPASQAIQDMFVLTSSYDSAIRLWIQNGCVGEKPQAPTELQLSTSFSAMDEYKMFSDTMIWHPVSYKLLFGNAADTDLQMQFKVIPSPATTMSDGEIKSAVINAINTYFSVQYWDFGDTFYWSELSAYIHIQLSGIISSIVIVPLSWDGAFGDGFEIPCNPDEIFISCAQVSNVLIISSNTTTNLRIK